MINIQLLEWNVAHGAALHCLRQCSRVLIPGASVLKSRRVVASEFDHSPTTFEQPRQNSSSRAGKPHFFEILGLLYAEATDTVVSASVFWEAGCVISVSNPTDGFSTSQNFPCLEDAVPWLAAILHARHPDRGFARRFGTPASR